MEVVVRTTLEVVPVMVNEVVPVALCPSMLGSECY